MSAAVQVIAERGYQASTADEVSRRAGVSKGLLWHYFDDLEDLFEQTARRTLLVLRTAVAAAIDFEAPVPEVIRAAVHGAADLRRTHGPERHALQAILLNLRHPDGRLRFSVADYDDTYREQEAIFRRGQQAGDVRSNLDPRVLATTYQGAVDGMLAHLDAHPGTDAHHYADAVADVLLDGLRDAGGRGRGQNSATA